MLRQFKSALFALTLALAIAFAQSGKMQVEALTGSLRSISSADLVLDVNDDRVLSVRIPPGTKYLSTMDKVKPSDFEPGDHVTVEAIRDDGDHYRATAITMNKKGTAADKAEAKSKSAPQIANASPAPAVSSPQSTNSDRPSLHRAVPSGNSDAGNSSNDTQSKPAPSTYPSDDSGPPALRRNNPAPSNSASAPANSAPAPANSAPAQQTTSSARPSLSAEDVNGVTRPPSLPAAPNIGSEGAVHGPVSDDDVIDETRIAAASFTESLPNYVVKQLTTRYVSDAASRGRTNWRALDLVTADVVYLDGKEHYQNVMTNGKPTRDASQTGSWSEGEFASSLQALLSPWSATDFRNKRTVSIVNRPAWKYDYTIEQQHSAWRIQTEGQTYQPSYTGSLWIDKETYRVLRIEMASRNMPRSFPIDTTESSIDYDFVLIGDHKYLLPVHSESLSCWRGTSQCSRNVIDFRNYKKYTADSSISFEGTVSDK